MVLIRWCKTEGMSMAETEEWEIDLDKPDNHPIMISTGENEAMGAIDLNIFVGNFKTKEDALEYADAVKEFLEERAGGKFLGRA